MRAEGAALPCRRRTRQDRRRGLRLHRVSEDPQPAWFRCDRVDRRRPEAIPVAELGARRAGGDFGLGAKRAGAVHQVAPGGSQEDSRHRPLRSPPADPLRSERRDLGLSADGRGQRGGGLRPGDGNRPVRHEAGRRLPRPGAVRDGGHRAGYRAAYAAGAVQLRVVRSVGHAALAGRIRPGESARVGGRRVAGHRLDRPGGDQWFPRLAAEHSAGGQSLHQGPDQGAEAHLRQGGTSEAQRHHRAGPQGHLPGDAAGVQRSVDRAAALAGILLQYRPPREGGTDRGPGQRLQASRVATLLVAKPRLRNSARRFLPRPGGLRGHQCPEFQGEHPQLRRLLRPGAARARQGGAAKRTSCPSRFSTTG